jgi:HEPN domain-containing protein
MTPLGREWVRKAESDWRAIRQLAAGRPKVHDAICFHCQQCAEKYLKALLHERGKRVPYIHNCEELVDFLAADDESILELQIPAAGLTQYAVEFRYPGRKANSKMSIAARKACEHIRAEIRRRLGLRPLP